MTSINKTILLENLVNNVSFQKAKAELPVIIGETNSGDIRIVDLTNLPNLLVSGTTKQGKTNFLKSLIPNLILRKEHRN